VDRLVIFRSTVGVTTTQLEDAATQIEKYASRRFVQALVRQQDCHCDYAPSVSQWDCHHDDSTTVSQWYCYCDDTAVLRECDCHHDDSAMVSQ